MHKFMCPELVGWVLDQLNKGHEESPGMWTIYYQAFEKNTGNLLLDDFCIGLRKQIEDD